MFKDTLKTKKSLLKWKQRRGWEGNERSRERRLR